MDSSSSIKFATVISALSKYTNVIFNLLAGAILSRILTPEDYGIVAVVMVFTAFFSLLSDMGLGTGVIQNKSLDAEDINNIYSFTIYLGIAITFIFILFSFPLASFYEDKVYIPIGLLLSISLLFNTLNMIPNAIMLRNKAFIKVGVRTVVSVFVSYVVAIISALLGFKYYSLVLQAIVASIITYFWNFYGSGLKFKIRPKFNSLQKILGYSSYQFVYSIITYAARNVDSLLTGKVMGNAVLGYYNKAYNLMLYPVTYLTSVISPVLHPILSDHKDDPEYIFKQYIKVFKILSLMGVYITVFCFYSAKEIVLILYGDKWVESIPCVAVLSLSIWLQMTSSSCPSIYQSLGKTKTMFYSSLMHVSVQIAFIFAGIMTKDIHKFATYVSVSFVFKFLIEYHMLIKKAFNVKLRKFYKLLIPEAINFCVLFGAMKFIVRIEIDNLVISAIYKVATSGIVYLVLICLTKQSRYLRLILPNKIKNKFTGR